MRPLHHDLAHRDLRRRASPGLVLIIGLLLSGCSSWNSFDIDPLRGERFDGEMADYGTDLRRSNPDEESSPTLFTTRAREIEKNLGY